MSWLYDGVGPQSVMCTVGEHMEAQAFVRASMKDERWNVLLIEYRRRSMLVLHQPASVAFKNGEECRYEAVSIVAGRYDAVELVEEIRAQGSSDLIRHLRLPAEAFVRLSCGYLSASELFGWPDQPDGLAADAVAYAGRDLGENVRYLHDQGKRVAEPIALWDDELDRAMEMLRTMDNQQRALALRILAAIPDA